MHSVSDLTTFSRATSGDIPPKLVGASTTVVGSKVYLYGGRLVTERRMVTDMWVFDLNALVWKKIDQTADDELPVSRYFHSADSWDHYLVVFGGMGMNPDAEDSADELFVLNDVRFFDLTTSRWMPDSWSSNDLVDPPIAPKMRYAHLSSVSGDRLFVIGGQDLHNVWLDDVYVYDLVRRGWVNSRDYPRHCGTYRSVAVAGNQRVRLPQHESRDDRATPKPIFQGGEAPSSSSTPAFTDADTLIHLPYSAPPSDDFPTNIYLYSNYNFTDVKRELEVFTPGPDDSFEITDQSSSMVGTSFPPGLRFPSGAILGHHLIIAGTYLAHSFQSSSVWALNLHDMTWTRIDPGSTLSNGSWFRTALWAEENKFVIFGNRSGNLVDDYNRRLLSWDDIAIIDLEAFGIYQPPRLQLDIRMQEIGLAALEEGVLADFEVVCDDDRRIRCSRRLLEERWPWFREQRKLFIHNASRAAEAQPQSPSTNPASEIAGSEPRPDPRLTPRYLSLSEPYPVTLALLQYLYSMALLTPLQHAPPVLSALLVLSTNYNIPHLQSLVKHAMHRALSNSTSVGVYEVATLCSCRSLQIRALKTVMLYNQRRPGGRARQDKDGSGRSPAEANGHNGPGSGGSGAGGDMSAGVRPRGMSDAQLLSRQGGTSTAGGRAVLNKLSVEDYETQFIEEPIEDAPVPEAEPSRMASPPPFLSRKLRPSMHAMHRHSTVSIGTHLDLTSFGDLLMPGLGAEEEPESARRERNSLPIDEEFERSNRSTISSRLSIASAASADAITPAPRLVIDDSTANNGYASSIASTNSSSRAYARGSLDRASAESHDLYYLSPSSRFADRRDSDTPSLSSSNSHSSFSSAPPHSPSLNHPPSMISFDTGDYPHSNLSTIDEYGASGPQFHAFRRHHHHPYAAESVYDSDEDVVGLADKQSSKVHRASDQSITFASPSPPMPSLPPPTTFRQRMPNIDALRLQTKSPAETIHPTALTPEPSSPLTSLSPATPPPSSHSSSHGSKFARLLSSKSSIISPTTISFSDSASIKEREKAKDKAKQEQVKALKAEAKRLKKEEDRLRKERLMIEFRAKAEANKRKGDAHSVYSEKSEEHKSRKAAWEESGALYGGMTGFL